MTEHPTLGRESLLPSRVRKVAWCIGTMATAAANVATLSGTTPLSPAVLKSISAVRPWVLVFSWAIALFVALPMQRKDLLATREARRRFVVLTTLLVLTTYATAPTLRQVWQRSAVVILGSFGLVVFLLATRFGLLFEHDRGTPGRFCAAALRRLGAPLYASGRWLGITTSDGVVAKLVLGSGVLVFVILAVSLPVAAAVERANRLVTKVETKAVHRGLVEIAPPPIPPGPYNCADYAWAQGGPRSLANVMRRSGRSAARRFDACAISPVHVLAVDRLYEQYAFTRDSNRARVVGWIDDAGEAHATFVTSDEANGYSRYVVSLSWLDLGMPLPMKTCRSRFVQPFVGFDGQLRGVGVAARRDVIGLPNEAIYVPAQLLEAWLDASEYFGRPMLPAGQPSQGPRGLQQFVHDASHPLVTSSRPLGNALARLESTCERRIR